MCFVLAGLTAQTVTIHNRFPASMIVVMLLRRPMMVLHHLRIITTMIPSEGEDAGLAPFLATALHAFRGFVMMPRFALQTSIPLPS